MYSTAQNVTEMKYLINFPYLIVLKIEMPKILTTNTSADHYEEQFPIAGTLHDFRTRFYLFTGGLLEGLDWTNIFCAGGSVLGIA
jgi:hypothetical protein